MEIFKDHPWPGNIRELENLIQSLLIMTQDQTIRIHNLPKWMMNTGEAKLMQEVYAPLNYENVAVTLKDFIDRQEKKFIKKTLHQHGGNMSKTAAQLKVSRNTLYNKLNQQKGAM